MDETGIVKHTRAYQQEMFERTMKGNTIVVMDTGSGKTQVAVLRIQAELERCSAEKRVWYIAPSVELCTQQYNVLQEATPAHKMCLLTGQDNVDKWSDQSIWDAALDHVHVVVSTPAILADALKHGFVDMASLALLVFDEAHHCIKKSAANVIMKSYYHERRAGGLEVPHILGLSASLIMSSKIDSFSDIETNLDAIGVTPRLQRQDLARHVFRPDCRVVHYQAETAAESKGLRVLCSVHMAQHASHNQLAQQDDGVQVVLKKFFTKALHIQTELGACAADFFIYETINVLRNRSNLTEDLDLEITSTASDALLLLLDHAQVQQACEHQTTRFSRITAKVQCLIKYLLEADTNAICGIVFVNQRVVASVLSTLLNEHTSTSGKIRSVASVGTSSFAGRKHAVTDLITRQAQREALSSFRRQDANIVIATSVLEEGIDVQACNVVACFDLPPNLKSFIQRRGRARHQHSRYGMLLEINDDKSKIAKWHTLEQELTALCLADRQPSQYTCLEEEDVKYVLRAESTGAKLDVDSTLQHLYHFCQQLGGNDARPVFTYYEDKPGQITADVELPPIVPAHVRHATSEQSWRTEKAARKDAAFHAYAALFAAKLLNDNLLPISQEWNVDRGLEIEPPPARVSIETLDVWAQHQPTTVWQRLLMEVIPPAKMRAAGEKAMAVILNTTHQQALPPELELFWDRETSFVVRFDHHTPYQPTSLQSKNSHQFTSTVYRAPRSSHHWLVDDQLHTLLEPLHYADWLARTAKPLPDNKSSPGGLSGLVRVRSRNDKPYMLCSRTEHDQLVCTRLPKRKNFTLPIALHDAIPSQTRPQTRSQTRLQQWTETFVVNDCTTEDVPLPWARVGLFLPDIFQHIHDHTVLAMFRQNIWTSERPGNELLLTALTTPSAQRSRNYQRLEFLGDCILKFVTSCQLWTSHPDWPEGYLTRRRAVMVCNATLAAAAIRLDIGQYLINEPVDYRHWTLPSPSEAREPIQLSSKTLADVIEALIGATWLDQGINAASECIVTLIPALKESKPVSSLPSTNGKFHNKLHEVETLLGYRFANPALLLQALTHSSYAQISKTNSYERLEFLGDAVLDLLITEMLAERVKDLSQGRMTQIKAALVNGDLLGFLCWQLGTIEHHRAIDGRHDPPQEIEQLHERSLADHLMFHPDLATKHKKNRSSYHTSCSQVQRELYYGSAHPWTALRSIAISKSYSDMVESIIGAIFCDSNQQLDGCREFLRRLGLLQYAARVINEDLDVTVVEKVPDDD